MPASLFAAWAGNAGIKFGVTAVTGVTNSDNLSWSAASADVGPALDDVGLQAPSATRVVTAVTEAYPAWLPYNSKKNQRSNRCNPSSPEISIGSAGLGANDPIAWSKLFQSRVAYRLLSAPRSTEAAESLAFSDCLLQWHRRHGAKHEPERCAGCRELFVDNDVLDLGSGVRVHLDPKFSCLTRYGQAWRSAALAGLQALGLEPPAGFELL